jgi:hypothetical protein
MRSGYAIFALGLLGLYGMSSWRGWEVGASKRGLIPANVRQSPGGYRSFTYWRGGK